MAANTHYLLIEDVVNLQFMETNSGSRNIRESLPALPRLPLVLLSPNVSRISVLYSLYPEEVIPQTHIQWALTIWSTQTAVLPEARLGR